MKKLCYFAAAVAMLVSCGREAGTDTPAFPAGGTVSISADLPSTKTALGPGDGTSYPNYWSQGDVVSVNGAASSPVAAEYAGTSRAELEVSGVSSPYYAAFRASALSSYDSGSATVTIPSAQNWRQGTYDPSAFVMLGHSDTESMSFVPAVALFKITPRPAPE